MSSTIAGLYSLIPYLPASLSPEKPKDTSQVASPETKASAPIAATTAGIKRPTVVVAMIELENGQIISISEDTINQKISEIPDLPKNLPRTMHLKIKYDIMAKLMASALAKGKARNFTILDPTLHLMYSINTILTKDFKPDAFRELEKHILSLSRQNPDKPYLIIMFAQTMLKHQKISMPEAKILILKAEKEFPRNAEIKSEVAKFYFGLNKIYTAGNYIAQAAKLDPSYQPELGKYYILKSEIEKESKDYKSALEGLETAQKIFENAVEDNPGFPLSIIQANLSLKKAEIYLLQEKHSKAYKALEFSADIYTQAAEAKPELNFSLARTYLMLLNVNNFLPGFQEYLKYHTGKCQYNLKKVLKKAENIGQEKPQLLQEVANAYVAIGKTEEAIRILQGLINKDPKNPFYRLELGDLLLSEGEIKAAFKHYQLVPTLAKGLDVLSEVYLRFFILETQAEFGLAQLKSHKPNAAQAFLNSLALFSMSILNPGLGIANMLGRGINKAMHKRVTQEDLREIIRKARSLKMESFSRIYSLADKGKKPMIFFLIAESTLARSKKILMQIEQMEEKEIVTEEEIKTYKDIAKEIKNKAAGILEFILNEGQIENLEAEFQGAKDNRDIQKIFEIAQNYFAAYLFLADKSKNEILDDAHKEIIAEKKEAAFEKGVEMLEDILDFSEEVKDKRFSFGVYDLSNKFLKKFKASNKKEQKKVEEITKLIMDSLEATIEIAKENKDLDTLQEMSKGINQIGPFALKALQEAIALAEDDQAKLLEIGELAYGLWRKSEGTDLIETLAIKEALRKLAHSAYQKTLEKAQGEEKAQACRKLWILGDHTRAYSGYISLVDFYKVKNDQKLLGNLYYELGLMAAVQAKTEEALTWLDKAVNLMPKEAVKQELEYLKTGKLPDATKINGKISFTPQQIRAAMNLYALWENKLEEAISDLYLANKKRAKARVSIKENGIEVNIKEQTIDEIKIVGNSTTKTDVIERELKYAGLKAGNDLSTDPSKIYKPVFEAANRIESFTVNENDIKLVNKDGKNILIVKAEEQEIASFLIGGGGGNAQAMANFNISHNNLLGGGEKIGVDFSYIYFYPKGYNHYHTWNGRLYYFDPHLFVIGKDMPVSGGINAEKISRLNYENNTLEEMYGGGVTLGVKIAEGAALSISPQFYHIQNGTSYFQPSIRIGLKKDGRDNWLFPKSGYFFSTSVEPGWYVNDSTQFFIKNINEGRFYIELPGEMSIALRVVAGLSHNLLGGNKFFLGGNMLNPFVRVSNGSTSIGPAVLAGNLEVRAPVVDLGFTKIQFYGFGDIGTLLGGKKIPLIGSAGAGARILLPVLGPINIGYGYPGGFFIWFGNMGWN